MNTVFLVGGELIKSSGRTMTDFNSALNDVLRYGTDEERQSFEQAVRKEPTESLHHLAWADWLDENGEPEEAKFRRQIGNWLRKPLPHSGGHHHYPGYREAVARVSLMDKSQLLHQMDQLYGRDAGDDSYSESDPIEHIRSGVLAQMQHEFTIPDRPRDWMGNKPVDYYPDAEVVTHPLSSE